MILFKYMSYEASESILESNSIGFVSPDSFNDPFELQAAYPTQNNTFGNSDTTKIIHKLDRLRWCTFYGVLSLTRSSNNPLMWAHYADEHHGAVLGINVKRAGFLNTENCVIPAHLGNVVYTNTIPTHPIIEERERKLEHQNPFGYPFENPDRINRLFLNKSANWSYEEEVRIVKNLDGIYYPNNENPSGVFNRIAIGSKQLHCYKLPEDSIVSVQFGLRHPFSNNEERAELVYLQDKYPNVTFSTTSFIENTWNLQSNKIS